MAKFPYAAIACLVLSLVNYQEGYVWVSGILFGYGTGALFEYVASLTRARNARP